jgi:hypothetical protein
MVDPDREVGAAWTESKGQIYWKERLGDPAFYSECKIIYPKGYKIIV